MSLEQLALLVHIGTISTLAVLIVYTDHIGVRWMFGKVETVSPHTLRILHRLIWCGLALMLASGFTMFLSYKDFLLYTPVFFVKMFFVVALTINGFSIGKFMGIATEKAFAALSPEERTPLFISGAISTVGWVSAIVCGLILSNLI